MTWPRFITLEGGEGAGKSTQLKKLADAFARASIPAVVTREPGGSAGGEAIRGLVVSGAVDRWDATTEALLFMTARYDHVATNIKPALARGEWVLCDRFYDSTAVYQGMAKNVGTAWLDGLYALLFGNFTPHLTLWLDLPPAVGLARAEARGNAAESRFESMGLAYHEQLREGFRALSEKYPARIQRVDATADADSVHRIILNILNVRFGLGISA